VIKQEAAIAFRNMPHYNSCMSVLDIIRELPALSPKERRDVRHRLTELEEANEDVRLCDASALEGAMMLDQMEASDDQSTAR
jgi:hypothetical protein